MIGSVSEEGYSYHSDPSETEWRATLAKTYGADKADKLVDAMKAANPGKSIRTLSYGVAGLAQRNNVTRMVKLKQAIGGAPGLSILVYLAVPAIGWRGGRLAYIRARVLL